MFLWIADGLFFRIPGSLRVMSFSTLRKTTSSELLYIPRQEVCVVEERLSARTLLRSHIACIYMKQV